MGGLWSAVPRCTLRPLSPLVDPGPQNSHLVRSQSRFAERHDDAFFRPGNQQDQPALRAFTGLNHGPGIPPSKRILRPVEAQAAQLLLGTMTAVAAGSE